ncbi:hypothetical protein ACFX12_000328 [Malus domestica]
MNQIMRFWTTQGNPSTSGSGPLNGTKTPKGIPNHSTESQSKRDLGHLNGIRVDTILDHLTESRSTMHIKLLNEIQAGYDSKPLNKITEHEGFWTTQRNPDGVGN